MSNDTESTRERWQRRVISILVLAAFASAFIVSSPLLLPAAVIVDSTLRRRFALTRALAAVGLYLACEVLGLVAAAVAWLRWGRVGAEARFVAANYRLQQFWAGNLLRGAMWIYGMRAVVEGEEALVSGPILLFVRHASSVDTLLAANFVAPDSAYRLRYVMKRELLWDPCLDVVGQRIPNVFIQRGSGDSAKEIAAIRGLARDLGSRDGVLIYPEGTRATPAKRAHALERIAAADPARHERVAGLRQLLPPRYGGPLGLIEERPDVDVVFLAHVGFDGVHSLQDLWHGTMIGREIRIRFRRVSAGDIPAGHTARESWLDREWLRMDEWVDAQTGRVSV